MEGEESSDVGREYKVKKGMFSSLKVTLSPEAADEISLSNLENNAGSLDFDLTWEANPTFRGGGWGYCVYDGDGVKITSGQVMNHATFGVGDTVAASIIIGFDEVERAEKVEI